MTAEKRKGMGGRTGPRSLCPESSTAWAGKILDVLSRAVVFTLISGRDWTLPGL